ncbi:MAG: hypothetical protein NTY41_02360 [Proteobacteria bacterium]|nr:hypothetical protein [Pseudomonadota bacterium]
MEVISRGDLSSALAHSYYSELGIVTEFAKQACAAATDLHRNLQAIVNQRPAE